MKKDKIILSALMISSLVLTGCFSEKVADDQWVAKVNSTIISTTDLQDRVKQFPQELQANLVQKENKVKVLDQIINEEVIYQEAKKSNISKNDAFKSKMSEAKKQMALLEKQTLINLYLEEKVNGDIEVSEEEIVQFYNSNQDKFAETEQRKAKHILVKTDSEAKAVLSKIRNGQSFEKLAAQVSIDPTGKNGGDLGWFGKGQVVPEFEAAVFSLSKGRVSKVVKTQFGYHIIKVEDIKVIPKRQLNDVKDQIKQVVMNQKKEAKTTELIKSLKDTSKITRNLDNIPNT